MARHKEYEDNFTRNNADPLDGDWTGGVSDWDGSGMTDQWQLVSNAMYSPATGCRCKHDNVPGNADQYAQLTASDYGDTGVEKLYISLRTVKFENVENSYYLIFHKTSGSVYIARIDDGSYGVLASVATDMADGDVCSVEVETTDGSTVQIRMYIDGDLKLSHDDTDAARKTVNGYIAIKGQLDTTGDDFECGYLGPATTSTSSSTSTSTSTSSTTTSSSTSTSSTTTSSSTSTTTSTSTSSTTTSSSTSTSTSTSSTTTSSSTSTSTSTSSTTTSSSTSTTTSTSTSTSSTTTSSSTSTSTTTSTSTSTTTTTSTSTSSTTTSSSTSTTTSTTTSLASEDFIRKRYAYRIYNSNVYVTTWADEVISEPRFRNVINGGPGELIVKLARDFDDFGEDVDVTLNYRVDLYVFDRESPNGLLLYRGFISGYRPVLDGPIEFIEITILSYVFELSRYMLRDGSGDTEIAYNSQDPSAILEDIIDKYRADGGTLTYTASSIDDTNSIVSYTFNNNTVKEAIDKVIELAPEGWYWNIDPDGTINFKLKPSPADHIFNIGSHIAKMETWRRIEDLINRVYFTGFTTASGTGLYRIYTNTGSLNTWGLRALNKVDHRVTNPDTADIMANRILDVKNQPEIRTLITIVDNNGEAEFRGYDIESIQPGETMEVGNLKEATKTRSLWDQFIWETDVWDQTLASAATDVIQIMSVEYEPSSVRLEASSRMPEIPKRVEDIYRNLEQTQTVDNPATPVAG